jgi:glyoxylase-like metal-dependent hydrolase (beta-lactamase superfamily II)
MTVVRLSGGEVLLYSPAPIDNQLAVELAEIGPVAHIVAPNRFHHLHVKSALERYPDARTYAAPGLPEKRPDLRFDEVLRDGTPLPLMRDFAHVLIRGVPAVGEVVFFHPDSKSLIAADLVFNIGKPKGLTSQIVFRTVGTYGRLAQSRLWRWTRKDAEALRRSYEHVLAWDFERIIVCHGAIVEEHAKDRLRDAMSWAMR